MMYAFGETGYPVDYSQPQAPPAQTDRTAWLYDQNATPPASPVEGQEWYWTGSQWSLKDVQTPGVRNVNVGTTPETDRQNGLVGGYYDANGTWVSGSPTSTGGGGGGGIGGGSGKFDYGRPEGLLPYSPYREMAPFNFSGGKFAYPEFKGSSWEDAEKEPGFAAAQDRLRKQIESGAAYQGILRSGMTLGRLDSVLDTNRGQNFANFDARNFRNWSANRDNAADAWARNLGAEQFSYGQQVSENERFNNYRFNTESDSFKDMLSRWQTLIGATTALARPS